MSHLNRRQALRLFAAAGVAGAAAPLLSACTSDSDSSEANPVIPSGPPVKIGMIVPLTGSRKDLGNEMDNGFQLYLKLHDNKLGNREVQLVKVDEGDTAETGKAAAEKLVKEDRVLALTGVAGTASMLAMKDTIENAQVPLVGSNASPTTLQGAKYIWRTSFVANEPGQALSRWAVDNAGGPLAVVGADSAVDDDEAQSFADFFKNYGGVVNGGVRKTPAQSKDYSSVLQSVRNSGVAGMFAFYSGAAAIDFVKQFKAAKFPGNFKLIAPGSLTEGYVLKQQGMDARDIYTSMNYSPDLDNAANRRFVADYQKSFGAIPSTYAMASYDAAAVLDKAIGDASKGLDSFSLNAAIGKLGQIDSPRGSWQFTQNRTPLQRWYLRQVRMDGAVLSNVLTAELTTLG